VYFTLKLWHSCANRNYQTLTTTSVLPKKKKASLQLFDDDLFDSQQTISNRKCNVGGRKLWLQKTFKMLSFQLERAFHSLRKLGFMMCEVQRK